MNKLFFFYIILIFHVFIPNIMAQHKDCETALELCGDSPFYITPGSGIGITDLGIDTTCVLLEFNSMWVKWTVLESGIITFVLTPDSVLQDIDFIVFHAPSEYDCENKIIIRCMASGANSGQPPSQWENCAGPTGLSLGDMDIEETAGCLATDNNFLAPIEATAGDQYIMLVNVFSEFGYGYTLSFGGTAVLNCITVSTYPEEVKSPLAFTLFPTISSGTFYIRMSDDQLSNASLNVFNPQGQLVYSNDQLFGIDFQIDLNHLPQGTYFATLKTNNSSQTKKFLITK